MSNTIHIDVDSGKVSRTIGGAPLPSLKVFLRDILALRIGFVQDGVAITSTILAGPATIKVGLRSSPGAATLLALATSYTLSGELALVTISLNTAELVAYFTDDVDAETDSANFVFEVEVTASDESTRQTFCQLKTVVHREVNETGDTAPSVETESLYTLRSALFDASSRGVSPAFVNFRPDVLGLSGGSGYLDGIVTTNLTVPTLIVIYVAGELQDWLLETSTAATAEGIQRPLDYNGSTNTRVWTRKR